MQRLYEMEFMSELTLWLQWEFRLLVKLRKLTKGDYL